MTMLPRNERRNNVLFNFSPWLLAIACTLLLTLLTIFAVSNYQREKELVVDALAQKGLTLIRFINSSVRESIRNDLRSTRQLDPWRDHMQAAMEQAVEQPGVEFVLLVNSAGTVLSGAGAHMPQNVISVQDLQFVSALGAPDPEHFLTRIVVNPEKESKKFQLAAWYLPPLMGGGMHGPPPDRGSRREMMMSRSGSHPLFPAFLAEMERLQREKPVYLIQLDYEQFSSPLRRQLLQIIILLVVILLVGIGGALAFATLKGLKGSQLRLGKMRAFTDILISSLPVGLLATDSSGVLQICNDTACTLLHQDARQLTGRLPEVCLPHKLAQMFSGMKEDGLTERQAEVYLDRGPSKGQTLQLASVVVLDDDGGFAGEVMLIRDLTTMKRLEKELQRSERLAALGKMAAGVAHELRNPLSSIKGLAVVLRAGFSDPSREAKTADILVKEVERLNRSIGELLDYARPGQLKIVPASLPDIIDKTVSLIRVDAQSYNIAIHIEPPGELPLVPVDIDKMNQVFLNLFLNAIQAMDQGGEMSVGMECSGQEVTVIIRDSGIGIPPENLGRIFDPYFTTKNDGTGLGLAMTSKIIEEHGGQLRVSSSPGEWTEVRVVLPL